jgi:hypothetical protein
MGVNLHLLQQAKQNIATLQKQAFVAATDPAMAGGGTPPMDPAMAGGGAPPMDPAMAGGGDPMTAMMPMIQMAVQQAMASQGGGMQGAGPGLKPKIDVNVEIMQIKKMLAKIVDALGIHIPAQDMVATPEDLNQIAQGGAGYAASTPDNGGGGLGQIQPIEPMKAAEWEYGVAFTPPADLETAKRNTQSTASQAAALLLRSRARN